MRPVLKKESPHFCEPYFQQKGVVHIAGVDEVGRGPLAGPVIAAAVIFPPNMFLPGINDSKRLSPKQRDVLYPLIKEKSLSVGLGMIEAREIDQCNILRATVKAMELAVIHLQRKPDLVLVDGNQPLNLPFPQECLVKGDGRSHAIGAASIVAKVVRDKLMESFHYRFPAYNFLKNKGYGTREHLEALERYGPCAIHRRTFRKVIFY